MAFFSGVDQTGKFFLVAWLCSYPSAWPAGFRPGEGPAQGVFAAQSGARPRPRPRTRSGKALAGQRVTDFWSLVVQRGERQKATALRGTSLSLSGQEATIGSRPPRWPCDRGIALVLPLSAAGRLDSIHGWRPWRRGGWSDSGGKRGSSRWPLPHETARNGVRTG